jgi:hypothetical protein
MWQIKSVAPTSSQIAGALGLLVLYLVAAILTPISRLFSR